jgi:hypothetical protein
VATGTLTRSPGILNTAVSSKPEKGNRNLKNLILLALVAIVALGVWSYYTKNGGAIISMPAFFENNKPVPATKNPRNYQCDGRQHCSQMRSYEEAKYFINNCPNTKMDGDNDGIPCERQFGR